MHSKKSLVVHAALTLAGWAFVRENEPAKPDVYGKRMEAISDSIGAAIEEWQKRPNHEIRTPEGLQEANDLWNVEPMEIVVDRPGTEKVTIWIAATRAESAAAGSERTGD